MCCVVKYASRCDMERSAVLFFAPLCSAVFCCFLMCLLCSVVSVVLFCTMLCIIFTYPNRVLPLVCGCSMAG